MILSEAKLIVFLSVVNVLLAHGAETDSAASDCCHPSEPDAKRNVVSAVFLPSTTICIFLITNHQLLF